MDTEKVPKSVDHELAACHSFSLNRCGRICKLSAFFPKEHSVAAAVSELFHARFWPAQIGACCGKMRLQNGSTMKTTISRKAGASRPRGAQTNAVHAGEGNKHGVGVGV